MRLHGKIQLSLYDLSCVEQAITYIEKHYRNAISIEQLSIEIGMSIKKLRTGLKKRTGLTLHEYHFRVRIRQSMSFLADTGYPLKAIASFVGFKTESHFCRRFKEITSMTPIEYRLQSVDCVQLAAGPAGLTAAYELLKRTDIVPVVLEKSGEIGGISRTINYKGNRMDMGPHRFFSKGFTYNIYEFTRISLNLTPIRLSKPVTFI